MAMIQTNHHNQHEHWADDIKHSAPWEEDPGYLFLLPARLPQEAHAPMESAWIGVLCGIATISIFVLWLSSRGVPLGCCEQRAPLPPTYPPQHEANKSAFVVVQSGARRSAAAAHHHG